MLNKYLVAIFGICAINTAYAVDVQIPVATSAEESASVTKDTSDKQDSDANIRVREVDESELSETAKSQLQLNDKKDTSQKNEAVEEKSNLSATTTDSAGSKRKSTNYLQQVGMPEVPINVMKKSSNPSYAKDARINDKSVLVMEAGVNQIVPVAVDHLNRIVTPFSEPVVTTMSNNATTEVNQNVVYIGTNDDDPVTAFITEKGDQSRALSLTLVPQRIPPRELFLRLSDGFNAAAPMSNPKAEKWESSQPYVETIRAAFRSIALGDLPQGYAMARFTNSIPVPHCDQPGLRFDFRSGQVLSGHSLSILVGVAKNTTSAPIEFKEAACGNWDIAAVAAWPINVLEPGEATEVYVARKVNTAKPVSSKRPSLLGR